MGDRDTSVALRCVIEPGIHDITGAGSSVGCRCVVAKAAPSSARFLNPGDPELPSQAEQLHGSEPVNEVTVAIRVMGSRIGRPCTACRDLDHGRWAWSSHRPRRGRRQRVRGRPQPCRATQPWLATDSALTPPRIADAWLDPHRQSWSCHQESARPTHQRAMTCSSGAARTGVVVSELRVMARPVRPGRVRAARRPLLPFRLWPFVACWRLDHPHVRYATPFSSSWAKTPEVVRGGLECGHCCLNRACIDATAS